jgi:hypothetical protein
MIGPNTLRDNTRECQIKRVRPGTRDPERRHVAMRCLGHDVEVSLWVIDDFLYLYRWK